MKLVTIDWREVAGENCSREEGSYVMEENKTNTFTMPSANGKGAVYIEKILDEELADKCGLYAKVTIPAGSVLGYHEHHGIGESYFVLSGSAIYDDNGVKRTIGPGDQTWTPDGSGHGVDNSKGAEDIVFMALIVNK